MSVLIHVGIGDRNGPFNEEDYNAYMRLPFLDLANGNFGTLWDVLFYFHGEWEGEMRPDNILRALDDTVVPALMKEGIPEERAKYYFETLKEVCVESQKRGVMVVWG